MTDAIRYSPGPRNLKKTGSPDWCWQTIDALKRAIQDVDMQESYLHSILQELKEARVWEVIPPGRPFGSLDKLLQVEVDARNEDDLFRLHRATKEKAQRAARNPDNGKVAGQGERVDLSNLDKSPQSDRASKNGISRYSQIKLDRLARDHPELLEDVKAGNLSINGAAIKAGIATRTVSIPVDVERGSRLIAKHFEDDLQELVDKLQEYL